MIEKTIPVTYLGTVIGQMNVETKHVVFNDLAQYNDIVSRNDTVGISSRSIGEIKGNLVVNEITTEACLITITKIK